MALAINNSGFQYFLFQLKNWTEKLYEVRISTPSVNTSTLIDESEGIPDFLISTTGEELAQLRDNIESLSFAIEDTLTNKGSLSDKIQNVAKEAKPFILLTNYLLTKYKPDLSKIIGKKDAHEEGLIADLTKSLSGVTSQKLIQSLNSFDNALNAEQSVLKLDIEDNYVEDWGAINIQIAKVIAMNPPLKTRLFIEYFNDPTYNWLSCILILSTINEDYNQFGSEELILGICDALNESTQKYIENIIILSQLLSASEYGERGFMRIERFISMKETNYPRFEKLVNFKISLHNVNKSAEEAGLSDIPLEQIYQELNA